MELKRGYKYSEVGEIPENWDAIPLSRILEFKNGLNKAKQFFGVGTPIVNYMDVYENPGLWDQDIEGKVTVTPDEIRNYNVKKGDVFFTRTSETVDEIGISSVMLEEIKNAVFSGFVLRGRPQNDLLELYYKQFCFSSKEVRKQITSTSSYTTRALTNGKFLSKVYIAVPRTKEEQTAIATALSDVDNLIHSLENLIVKKRNIKLGAMQELFKPKGDWTVKKLGEIGKPYGGLSGKSKVDFNNGKYPYIPFLNVILNPIIDSSYFDYVNINSGENQNKALKGDLFFNGSSETPEEVGMCSVLLEEVPILFLNSFCFGFRLNKELRNDGLFLSYFFRSNQGRKLFYSLAQGATRYNLSKYNFQRMEISLPEPEQQIKIANILLDIDTEIKSLNTKLEKYKMIKQGMMQKLLTGQIRLV